MAKSNNNRSTVFETMKYTVAKEVGVNLKQADNGNLTTREVGKIGGRITQIVFDSYVRSNS